ncbi:hypothetical protein ACXN5S_14965 [Pseudoroseicyclus sp. H15]
MVGSSKILTVSYGTFSCTLEGFDDSFGTMKAIAEYFRDLASDDRYFGAEPPTPDAEMLARIAEREISRRVDARTDGTGIVLRAAQLSAPAAQPEPEVEEPQEEVAEETQPEEAPQTVEEPVPAMPPSPVQPREAKGGSVEDKLARIRAVVGTGAAAAVAGEAMAGEARDEQVSEAPAEEDWAEAPSEDFAETPVAEAPDEAPTAEPEPQPADTPMAEGEAEAPGEIEDTTDEQAQEPADEDWTASDMASAYAAAEADPAETVHPEDLAPAPADEAEESHPSEADEIAGATPQHADETPAPEPEQGLTEMAMPYDSLATERDYEPTVETVDATDYQVAPPAEDAGQVGPALPETEHVGAEETDSPFVGTLADEDEAALLAELAALEAEVGVEALDALTAEGPMDAAPGDDAASDVEDWPADEELAGAMASAAAAGDPGHSAPAKPGADELAEAEADLHDWSAGSDAVATRDNAEADIAAEEIDPWEAELDAALAEEFGETAELDEPAAGAAPRATTEENATPAQDDPAPPAEVADEASDEKITEDEAEDWADGDSLFGNDGADLPAEPEPAAALDDTPERDHIPEPDPADNRTAWDEPRPFGRAPEADEDGLNRILSRTDEQLAEPGNSRRRDAIAQLKAAVAATEAARRLGEGDGREGKLAAFRDDLDQVVRPKRPVRAGDMSERPRTAPLKLVASQRVDMGEPAEPKAPVQIRATQPVRPRRVLPGEVPPAPAASSDDAAEDSFPAYASGAGAESLSDLLEVAAAYTSQVEGAEDFSRPQLMRLVGEAAPEGFSREEGLRSFGTLLRQGRIVKVRSGRFALSGTSRFHPERRAG